MYKIPQLHTIALTLKLMVVGIPENYKHSAALPKTMSVGIPGITHDVHIAVQWYRGHP